MNSRPPGGGLLASLRGLLSTALTMAQTRFELLAAELEEEKLRLLGILAYGALAVLLFCIGLVFLAIFLTLLWWDSHRLLVVGICTLAFLLGSGVALRLAQRQSHRESRLFAASLAELKQDREALRAHLEKTGESQAR
ncbi:MAG: phage holin family protein [Betaproteobacteria bacterium]|nr:phage holin family protein [Betaproteobacteria bacterium]